MDDPADSDACFDPELFRLPLRAVFPDEIDFAAAAALRAWRRRTLPVLEDLAIERRGISIWMKGDRPKAAQRRMLVRTFDDVINILVR